METHLTKGRSKMTDGKHLENQTSPILMGQERGLQGQTWVIKDKVCVCGGGPHLISINELGTRAVSVFVLC